MMETEIEACIRNISVAGEGCDPARECRWSWFSRSLRHASLLLLSLTFEEQVDGLVPDSTMSHSEGTVVALCDGIPLA
ncbi:hypothetical protein MUK42_33212 [Musa troglodytarum]|uniref:Uncharacterized protein n=1 Tax=Musa troglodytarum TaxID=320322 RepID=A0A9E7IK37_9LILI|nr:hypothetical protein MUK42_33212 [Musa troglodytarum]